MSIESVLNFETTPIDINIFNTILRMVYEGSDEERNHAQGVLNMFKEHPLSWSQVDSILDQTDYMPTKFFCLQVLDELVNIRWDILPPEQKDGIKNYVVNYIIRLSSTEESLGHNALILNKFNGTLLNIVKKEWPHNWGNFITEIVQAAQENESICKNNLTILLMLSEEVFDFSSGMMTEKRIEDLKTSLENDFGLIFQLCEYILGQTQSLPLIRTTLKTLHGYLEWISPQYVVGTELAFVLINQYLPNSHLRNKCIQCLIEIAAIDVPENKEVIIFFQKFFSQFMDKLVLIIPETININDAYNHGQEKDRRFVQNLSLFFEKFLSVHLSILENQEYSPYLFKALNYMLQITAVDQIEIFDITLDYWSEFTGNLYNQATNDINFQSRVATYGDIITSLCNIFISRMAKPEEVIIVENEDGQIVKEVLQQGEVMARYKRMKTVLVFLTNLDPDGMRNIMIGILLVQASGRWTRRELNSLCWAIGSIENILQREEEKGFLIEVLGQLLVMCEKVDGKDNKAVVASNIMYIVGQYPRFLSDHPKFLYTVITKLFEFMHEPHPGVKDMACETFLKITRKCQKALVKNNIDGRSSISLILGELPMSTSDLEYSQLHIFYESVGHMISAERDSNLQQNYLKSLLATSNHLWRGIMDNAGANPHLLQDKDITTKLTHLIKLNSSTCNSTGPVFAFQLANIYIDLLNVYTYYSEQISLIIQQQGAYGTSLVQVKAMRSVKRAALGLIRSYISVLKKDVSSILNDILPPLLPSVLQDYKDSIPTARDHEVLALLTRIVTTCKSEIIPQIPEILDSVFECTLEMITANFQDFPDHRVEFFEFLKAVTKHCFVVFKNLPAEMFQVIIHAIIWAFKHEVSGIAETGLETLRDILHLINKDSADLRNHFYRTFCFTLMQDLFFVLLDSVHKTNYVLQTSILFTIFETIELGRITEPIYDLNKYNQISNNQEFIRFYLMETFTDSFPNTSPAKIETFIHGIFQCGDLNNFQSFLRDFLIEIRQFSTTGDDNSNLFSAEKEEQERIKREQEMLVPGLVPAHDPRRDNEIN